MNGQHYGSSSQFDISLASDRRMIERAFMAAGDAPSRDLLDAIPAIVAATLADPAASHRDKARAAAIVQKMQTIQLDTLKVVDAIKARRQRGRDAQAARELNAPDPVPRHLLAMLDMLNEESK